MTLAEIKGFVERERYFYSAKVRELISEGFYGERDLECCILSATSVSKKERDEKGEAVHGMKYEILGTDTHGRRFYTVGKVVERSDGLYYFFITAHESDEDR